MSDFVIFDTIDDFWKWIHAIDNRQINLSHSFGAKNRCRKCGKHPTKYYNANLPAFARNPRDKTNVVNWLSKNTKRLMLDFYLRDDPSKFKSVSTFSHPVDYKGYNPRLHRTTSASTNMREYMVCECGMSVWVFSDMYTIAPEKVHRRSREHYPIKLKYY